MRRRATCWRWRIGCRSRASSTAIVPFVVGLFPTHVGVATRMCALLSIANLKIVRRCDHGLGFRQREVSSVGWSSAMSVLSCAGAVLLTAADSYASARCRWQS